MPRGTGPEIHTWCYPGKPVLPADLEKYSSWLDTIELKRAQDLVQPMDRDHFISSHLFLRKVLSLYMGTLPADIVFSRQPSGKPFISSPSGHDLFFSMSRSGSAAAVGVSGSLEVGVDLERIDELMPWKDMASSHFPPGEAEMIAGAPDPLKTFYRYWTLREAALKYLGTGLSISSDKVRLTCAGDGRETFSTITFASVGFSDILTGVSILKDDLMLSLVFKRDRGVNAPEIFFM